MTERKDRQKEKGKQISGEMIDEVMYTKEGDGQLFLLVRI